MSLSTDAPDYVYKLILLGDSNVGKTNILLRYQDKDFDSNSKATIGVELCSKKIEIDGKIIKASLWDTAGQERYRAVTSIYYRGSAGVLLVYDVTSEVSFENVQRWLDEIRNHADPDAVIMLIGNKTDLTFKLAVPTERASEFAKQNGLFFMETSAKDNVNIAQAFETIIQEIHKRKIEKQLVGGSNASDSAFRQQETVRIDSSGAAQDGKKGCCGS